MRHYSTRRRVLVTGGAGFLGSHLCDRLLADSADHAPQIEPRKACALSVLSARVRCRVSSTLAHAQATATRSV